MLTAVGGRLLSGEFLTEYVRADAGAHAAPLHRALCRWRAATATFGPASSVRALLDSAAVPLLALLDFDAPVDIERVDALLAATAHAQGRPVALITAPWGNRLDAYWQIAAVQAIRRAADWVLLFNGVSLRIVDAARAYARRHLEFDLAGCCDDPLAAMALERIAAAASFADDPVRSLRSLIAASDRYANGVCRSLRDGVLAASADVLGALVARERKTALDAAFEQALTIVYRILFLLFAEARALVPLWHPVYRRSYSIEALRDAAERGRARGLWDALRAIARLAHAGCTAGDLRVTPFNGRLFSPGRTPLANRRDLDDDAARRAVLALSTRPSPDGAARQRIAYRDLGVEQLGAVYETILDYTPHIERTRRGHTRNHAATLVTLAPGSGVRKSTGTFYTPQAVAECVVRRTLGPLVQDASAAGILSLRVVDPAMGSGAFLVAACRFLAGAYEQALVREGACSESDVGDSDRALFRRIVAERCLYGVDINPMAVQLARLSLWLATLASDRPLSFLDHRLRCGDSLLGVWVRQLRANPLRRRAARPMTLFDDVALATALKDAVPLRFSIESTPNDTLEQVRAKERTLAAMSARDAALSRWRRVADAWCASWFDPAALPPQAFGAISDALIAGRSVLPRTASTAYVDAAERIAGERQFFHWELEFPEVFFDADGRRLPDAGFHAVIGNPPWDMLRADAGPADARVEVRGDIAPVLRFARDACVYSAQSAGHPNRYQLFVERTIDLCRAGGRFGLVLPSGLASDRGSAGLRGVLLSRCAVDAITAIDNHRGVFPIHRSLRFLLLTASVGAPTTQIACQWGLDDPAELARPEHDDVATPHSGIRVSVDMLRRVSGPDLAIPALRTAVDVAIVERAASLFPPLGGAASWGATFGRELNATDDRGWFHPAGRGGLPIVEGKHLNPFSVRTADASHTIDVAAARRRLPSLAFTRARLAYRDVASATNMRTLIAAILPAGCVSTHTVFCLRTPLPVQAQHFLCGLFNSLVVNYLVRVWVTTHVTTGVVERLPLPARDRHPRAFREIAALARMLARRADADALARLDARVATLYQLSREEFSHVLDTFPLIASDQRARALAAFPAV